MFDSHRTVKEIEPNKFSNYDELEEFVLTKYTQGD